jgi:hypothetical protein
MSKKRKKIFLLVILFVVIGFLWGLNFVASKFFLMDIPWLLTPKGPACGYVNGWVGENAKSVDCPSEYYCDYSHSLIDGPGYCLKK